MKILVTGNAGFIGYHTAKKLLNRGDEVIGIDSVNDYYDQELKRNRLKNLSKLSTKNKYSFYEFDLCNQEEIKKCFAKERFDSVIHLAAQAGVRHSLKKPHDYIKNNIVAFLNILESSKDYSIEHLTYASTSSVYGANTKLPFSEKDGVDHPMQLYASTKRANELMAHSYSNLYNLPTTALRFFTVYGPWGRPDMALFKFTKKILEGKPIQIFNQGDHSRDFTYVDDIVDGIIKSSDYPAKPDISWDSNKPNPNSSFAPFRILNIGSSSPVSLIKFIEAIEDELGKKSKKEFLPLQPGDVRETYSDSSELKTLLNYNPSTPIKDGIKEFVNWYLEYYGHK